MKNNFKKMMVMTGVLALMSGSLISCSENDAPQLEIGGNVLTEGIQAEIDGALTTLSITANGDWHINIPEKDARWVYIPVTSGTGNQKVPVSIDANFGSSVGRQTTITITSGDLVKKIEVSQVPTFQGQTVANSEEGSDGILIAAVKGVGVGLNLDNMKAKINNVINLKALDKLIEIDAYYSSLFTYNIMPEANAQGAIKDSVETKKDSLGVALTFDISYGTFKLNIGGAYHGDESKNHYTTEYKYGATYSIASAYTDMSSLISLYNNADELNISAEEQRWRKCLLAPGFIDAKEWVEEAYESGDSDDFNDAVEDLVNQYGAAVIAGCDLGGSMSLWMKFDRDSIADVLHVDTAHIKMAVESGLLKVGLGVEVGYKKEGITVLENSAFKYDISGGDKKAQDAVTSILNTRREVGDSHVYDLLHDNIDAWIGSFDANNANTLSYTRLQIYPIWYFFDRKVKVAVKNWIKENCEDKLNIINNGVVDADVADN